MAQVKATDIKSSLRFISTGEDTKTSIMKLFQNQMLIWDRQNSMENRILELEKGVK